MSRTLQIKFKDTFDCEKYQTTEKSFLCFHVFEAWKNKNGRFWVKNFTWVFLSHITENFCDRDYDYCFSQTHKIFEIFFEYVCRKRASSNTEDRKSREGAITRILLLVSFAFLVLTVVGIIILYEALFYMAPRMNDDPWAACWFTVLMEWSELTGICNVSFNFLFYMMGSKIFRDGFKSMLKSKLELVLQK